MTRIVALLLRLRLVRRVTIRPCSSPGPYAAICTREPHTVGPHTDGGLAWNKIDADTFLYTGGFHDRVESWR